MCVYWTMDKRGIAQCMLGVWGRSQPNKDLGKVFLGKSGWCGPWRSEIALQATRQENFITLVWQWQHWRCLCGDQSICRGFRLKVCPEVTVVSYECQSEELGALPSICQPCVIRDCIKQQYFMWIRDLENRLEIWDSLTDGLNRDFSDNKGRHWMVPCGYKVGSR